MMKITIQWFILIAVPWVAALAGVVLLYYLFPLFQFRDVLLLLFFLCFYSLFVGISVWKWYIAPLKQTQHYLESEAFEVLPSLPRNEWFFVVENIFRMKQDIRKKKDTIKRLVAEIKNDQEQILRDGSLLRVISHDIANPIAVIKGGVFLAKHFIEDNMMDKLPSLLNRMERSAQICESILNQVRSMVMVDSAKKGLKHIPVCLDEVFEESQMIFEDRIKAKNLQILYQNKCPGAKFLADYVSFSNNVFNNILSNAIKFSDEGGMILVFAEILENRYHIEVQDNGKGIPEHLRLNLFNPEIITSLHGTSGERGTGFGLTLVKTYMDFMDGEVKVDSKLSTEEDQSSGTTVHLFLHLA